MEVAKNKTSENDTTITVRNEIKMASYNPKAHELLMGRTMTATLKLPRSSSCSIACNYLIIEVCLFVCKYLLRSSVD